MKDETYQVVDWVKIQSGIREYVDETFAHICPIDTLLDLFKRLVILPTSDAALSGISAMFTEALKKVLIEKVNYNVYVPMLANAEQLLRKILSVVNPGTYQTIKDSKGGLAPVITALNLNPHRINLSLTCQPIGKGSSNDQHLLKVYQFRNSKSHECESLNDLQLLSYLQSALVIYLYAIDRNISAIQEVVRESQKKYLNTVREDFKKWQNRFVSLEGREMLQEVALYAIETPKKGDEKANSRQGEVAQLRNELKQNGEYQMIIVGDAGMGKTTTMQYLSFKDSESGGIPIYLELKLLTAQDSILDMLKRKLADCEEDISSIMNSPETCIFLDGLNEVLPSIKESVFREIIGLIQSFPKTFFLISTRAQNYNGEFGKIPVFALQKMDNARILDFLKKNTEDKSVREKILQAIEDSQNWQRILGTPLILYMLIQVLTIEGEMPDDESKIILRFIKNLYSREKTKDFSFNEEWFHSILCHIAFENIDKVGDTNSGFTFGSVRQLLKGKISVDDRVLLETLERGVALNLLVKDGNLYSFSHQTYQDTLAGDYINTIYA